MLSLWHAFVLSTPSRLGKSADRPDRVLRTHFSNSTIDTIIDKRALEETMTTQRQQSTSRSHRDWRLRIVYERNVAIPTAAELGRIRCPFEITPEVTPTIPTEYAKNVRHYTATRESGSVPWTGYYATYFGAKLPVANAFGVWFEIRPRENTWEAIRPAPTSLKLKDWPLEGIDMYALSNSGERISITRLHGTRVATLAADSTDEESEEEDPKRITDPRPRSSQTEHGRGLRRPRGTGDDPFTLGDDDDDDDDDVPNGYRYLKGNTFDGDRSRTLTFLAEFNEFMFMNREAKIARDPVKKSTYFLSLIKGPNAEWWVTHRCEGLEEVEADPTAWQTLEQQFKNDFIDYAGPILAQAEILKLRMKEGNVDQYIDDFKELARRGGHNVDDPSNLRPFAQGLPIRLFRSCIDHESPETFEQ